MPLSETRSFTSFSSSNGTKNGKFGDGYKPSVNALRLFNTDIEAIEPSVLSCSMWNGFLKITITLLSPEEDDKKIDIDVFKDPTRSSSVFFNMAKAKAFSMLLQEYMKDPEKISGAGVLSGRSMINIYNGTVFGKPNTHTALRIIRFNKENQVDSTRTYECNPSQCVMTNNVKIQNGMVTYDRYPNTIPDLDLELLIIQLDEFTKAMTYSVAYSCIDANKNNALAYRKKLDSIINMLTRSD